MSRLRSPVLALLALFAALHTGCDDRSAASSTGGAGGGQGGAAPVAEPYTIDAFVDARITSDSAQPNFQTISAEIDLVGAPFASVTLDVKLDTSCYPFEKWQDDPPPEGQNWPPSCDAYDRNFEISIHDPSAPEGTPGVELVRAITPFGGPMQVEADLTDVANHRPGKHRLEIHITTWSDGAGQVSGSNGGWDVSASLSVVPGAAPREVLAIVPLFDGSDTDPNGPGPLPFTVPEGATTGRVEYRVTGHGGPNTGPGCNGPAEEFCLREHVILVDGAEATTLEPWRSDCEKGCTMTHYGPEDGGFDYCLENPCGHPASVRASRANWCPGSVTPPYVFELGLPAGAHDFSWRVPEMLEGGSWSVAATYFAYRSP